MSVWKSIQRQLLGRTIGRQPLSLQRTINSAEQTIITAVMYLYIADSSDALVNHVQLNGPLLESILINIKKLSKSNIKKISLYLEYN